MSNIKNLKLLVIIIILGSMIAGAALTNGKNSDKYKIEKEYKSWKETYVVKVTDTTSRVINPQDNNVTVSEGIGYGLLFSAAMKDKDTFDNLYNYMKSHLDKNGLMHWKIDSNGSVIGQGSASDADEDMAYALLLAYKTWNERTYLDEGKNLIELIAKYEINSEHIVLPGDSWGNNYPINPSYIAPLYYYKFAEVSGKEFWSNVANNNIDFLYANMNPETGFLPDWINYSGSAQEGTNTFGYDAVRVPIRLLQFYNETKNSKCQNILQTQYNFVSNVGADNLVASYSISGSPKVSYINSTYLSSFAASSYINNESDFSKKIIRKLNESQDNDYYGSSLKLWITLIIHGKL